MCGSYFLSSISFPRICSTREPDMCWEIYLVITSIYCIMLLWGHRYKNKSSIPSLQQPLLSQIQKEFEMQWQVLLIPSVSIKNIFNQLTALSPMLSTRQWRYTVWPTDVIKVVFRICSMLNLGASNAWDGFAGDGWGGNGSFRSIYNLNSETSV